MSEITDAEVITHSMHDPEVFGAIFERHFDAIYRYLEFRVGASVADDLAAEAFLTAFNRRSSFQLERSSARPWLFGIATRLVQHHYRAEQRQLQAYRRTGASTVEFDESAIIRRVDAGALGPALASALAALHRRDRDVLLLFAVAGQSYEAVADALGIPAGTVRSRLNRARRVVRSRLDLPDNREVAPEPRQLRVKEVTDG